MIRSFKALSLALLGLAASASLTPPLAPSAQGQMVGDAFGYYDPEVETERARWSGLQINGNNLSKVSPEEPDTLLLFVGEKSMTAGKGEGMSAIFGLDALGNPIADGLNVDFFFTSDQETLQDATSDGLSFVEFFAGDRAGLFQASAATANRQTERLVYRINADVETAQVEFDTEQALILAHTLVGRLRTAPILDGLGNTLGNGYGLTFSLVGADGERALIPAMVAKGSAEVSILTAGLGQDHELQASIGSTNSEGQELTVEQVRAEGNLPLIADYAEDLGLLSLTWGPITTTAGALLPDGTPISFQVLPAGGGARNQQLEVTGWVEAGRARATVLVDPLNLPLVVRIRSILGGETHTIQKLGGPS